MWIQATGRINGGKRYGKRADKTSGSQVVEDTHHMLLAVIRDERAEYSSVKNVCVAICSK